MVKPSDMPPASKRRRAVCFCALLAALSTVFLFGHERGHFYRPHTHNDVSAQSMAVAANVAAEHRLLLFYSRYADADGATAYEVYNRYPLGTYLALKLVTLPFGDDVTAQLYAGRMLTLLFFAGAAMFAYAAFCRVTGRAEIALGATLLTFCSFYSLYYADMVSTDIAGLFGVLLVFHGMVTFAEDGSLKPLGAKTAVAIFLDWHVMALVLPFVALGAASALRNRRGATPRRSIAATLWRSRHLRYGAFAAIVCASLMGAQLVNEHAALDGKVPFAALPTVTSYMQRLAFDEAQPANAPDILAWPRFLSGQLERVGSLAVPFIAARMLRLGRLSWEACCHRLGGRVGYGIALVALSCLGLLAVAAQHRLAVAALLASGWCWALVVRGSAAYHPFETLFFVGMPLVFFAAAATCVRHLAPRPALLLGLALATVPVFAASAYAMGTVGHFARGYEHHRAIAADMRAIRRLTAGGSICLPEALKHTVRAHRASAMKFFLAGRVVTAVHACEGRNEDFAISTTRVDTRPGLLTPDNQLLFLYRTQHRRVPTLGGKP